MFRKFLTELFRPTRRANVARGPARFVPRLEGFEQRVVPATFTVAAGASIQAAITAAAATNDGNDIINVNKATFTGNLVIPNSANLTNLVIQTSGTRTAEADLATIKANSGAVITVDGEASVTIKRLNIVGTGTQANQGVFVKNGGSATISNNFIRNFAPSSGEGIGIRVGQFQAGVVTGGTVTVNNNTVTGYGDAGIVVTNNSVGTVYSNTVTGGGQGAAKFQNGIEFSFGATGSVYSNTVTANGKKNTTTGSAGILLFSAGPNVEVGKLIGTTGYGNTVSTNDLGISVINGISPVIQYNTASANLDYGIGLEDTLGATIRNNGSTNGVSTGHNEPHGYYLARVTGTTANPVTITKNNGNSNAGEGFYFDTVSASGAGAWSMTANGNANGNKRNGYYITNSSNISISGLDGSSNGNANGNTLSGFFIENSSNVTVSNYNTNSNLQNGVSVVGSTGITVTSGIARLNTLNGYLFTNSSGLTITNNQAGNVTGTKQSDGGNGQNGFSFVNTDNSTVTGNTARLNNRNGFLFDAASTGSSISGNTMNSNNKGNNGSFDATDLSGTPTTVLNAWSNNAEGTKNKTVIN